MSPRPVVQDIRSQLRERILAAFEERSRTDGPRAVVMAELARDLAISTRTLYQVFPSKAELVRALMEDWANEVERDQQERLASDLSPKDRMRESAGSWVRGQDRFSTTFWTQVRRDFPDAAAVLNDQVRRSLGTARERLVPAIRDGVNRELALSLLMNAIRYAAEPDLCNQLGLSRQEAVAEAIELWCRGAMLPPGQQANKPTV